MYTNNSVYYLSGATPGGEECDPWRGGELTEKIQGTQQGHKVSHNVGTRLFSGFLVSFASGVVKKNCWMKQQSNTQKQGTYSYPNWLFGCSAWVTEPNKTQQVGYVGIR